MDLKNWILQACLRSVAVSNKQVDRLPWESVVFGQGPLPEYGEMIKIPPNMLVHGTNARLVMANAAGKWAPGNTLATMQDAIVKNQKDILEADRSCCLEISFLLNHVHTIADEWLHEAF